MPGLSSAKVATKPAERCPGRGPGRRDEEGPTQGRPSRPLGQVDLGYRVETRSEIRQWAARPPRLVTAAPSGTCTRDAVAPASFGQAAEDGSATVRSAGPASLRATVPMVQRPSVSGNKTHTMQRDGGQVRSDRFVARTRRPDSLVEISMSTGRCWLLLADLGESPHRGAGGFARTLWRAPDSYKKLAAFDIGTVNS